MPDNKNITGGYLWFLAGAAIGAAAALLLAPKSGSDLRDDAEEAAAQTGHELVGKGKELYDRGRQLAEEAADLFEKGRKMVKG